MTPEQDIDHEAVALVQAEVVRAAAESREPQDALDLVVRRLPELVGARHCFAVLVGGDQRARIVASAGFARHIPARLLVGVQAVVGEGAGWRR